RDGTYTDICGNTSGLVRPKEEMLGRNVRDFLPVAVVRRVRACAEKARRSGTPHTLEYELDVAGERRRFEARMTPSSDDEIGCTGRGLTPGRSLYGRT